MLSYRFKDNSAIHDLPFFIKFEVIENIILKLPK